MEQKALLAASRIEFLNSFELAVQKTIPQCIEVLFVKANESFSSLEQNRLLDTRSALVERGQSIIDLMKKNLDSLLERSIHTSYSTYRPSIDTEVSELTLIDPFAFEGDLKLEEITNRFRSESAEQLRDLNIRIALLFEQDNTNERENPFRPYLLSKCISLTFEELELSQEVTSLLLIRFSENFIANVQPIYRDVNNYLAQQGLAAQLQLKIKKSPIKRSGNTLPPQGSEASEENITNGPEQESYYTPPSRQENRNGNSIEQFFSGALKRAANFMGIGGGAQSNSDYHNESGSQGNYQGNNQSGNQGNFQNTNQSGSQGSIQGAYHGNHQAGNQGNTLGNYQGTSHGGNQGGSQGNFSWVQDGESVGEVLRDFFGGSGVGQSGTTSSGHNSGSVERYGSNSLQDQSSESVGPAKSFSFNDVLNKSVQSIQKSFTPSGSEMVNVRGEVRNLILEQRSTLNEMASNVQEQMTIDVVAMLFEYILRDHQVPAEVRAQLGRLQFLLLKIALRDNSLLTQKAHPARLLVNRIGSISLGIKSNESSGTLITNEICRIVELLLADESSSLELFTSLLDEFDGFITKELRAENQKTESAIEGVEKARNRTIRFAHTTEKLREALNGLSIDPVLKDFFENAWVYVVELADGQDHNRAYRYRLMVPDLLWSIVPKAKEEDRQQLLALLPIMLSTLKDGLESIQWEEDRKTELMNWLVKAHTKSLRLSPSATLEEYPSLSTIHNHFNNFFKDIDPVNFGSLKNQSSSEIRRFLDDAIKDLDIKVQLLDNVYEEELPSNDTKIMEERSDDADQIFEKLRTGIAIELRLGGEPSEGKLSWIDPALTSLILTLDGQEEPSMVSVRMFRRMIAHGRVRFIEAEPLFERAVQSLLKSADNVNKNNARCVYFQATMPPKFDAPLRAQDSSSTPFQILPMPQQFFLAAWWQLLDEMPLRLVARC